MIKYRTLMSASLLLTLAAPAQAEWRRYETAHFIIYSESAHQRVEELANGLERIDGLMRMATALPPQTQPVKVRIYEMADSAPVQAALGQVNTGVAGFYSTNALGPFAVTLRKTFTGEGQFTRELVLHHEYAHHFMLEYFPATYPGWYTEGFAELIGSSKIMEDGRVAYGWPAKQRGDAIAVDWTPLQEMLLQPPEKLYNHLDAYGQGWAVTHYLTFSKERAPQLRRYLAALTAGKSQAEAATAFGDLGALNREAHAYVTKGSFEYRPVLVPLKSPIVERVSTPSAGEAALIQETISFQDDNLAAYRKDSDREEERRRRTAVLESIRRDAAQYANDPFALQLLALAERGAGNEAAAEQAIDRLLTIQPNHVAALSLKSTLLSKSAAKATGAARAQRASQARSLAVRANKAAPDDPIPYVAYYLSFKSAGQPVPNTAVEGLQAAVEKLPDNTDYRQLLVNEFAAQRRWRDALATIMPLANSLHDSPMRQAAREQSARFQAEIAKQGKSAAN